MSEQPPISEPGDIPIRFNIAAVYAPDREMQPGSKISLAPIPAGIEYEEINRPEGTMICYVVHTPIGAFRFLFPIDAVKFHHEQLGKILDKPRIEIAHQVPHHPNGGQHG